MFGDCTSAMYRRVRALSATAVPGAILDGKEDVVAQRFREVRKLPRR